MNKPRKFVKQRNQKIADEYIKTYCTYRTLAVKYKVSIERIRQVLRDNYSYETRNKVYKIRTVINRIKKEEQLLKKLKCQLKF